MQFKILIIILPCLSLLAGDADNFYKSFINSYDLSGRYTHEYHPYVLKKTQESFLELEQFLENNGFKIHGHKLVFGYQEDAIMPYQTSWARQAIEDEPVIKNHAGLCLPSKNIFGLMTGFIFKDIQWLEQDWLKRTSRIEHIFARSIDLFNDEAVVFQKHAFGKSYDYLISVRNNLEKIVYDNNMNKILQELVFFWSYLYENASKTSSDEIISFQDVLFSIDYAKALSKAKSPIQNIFIGPDITYPIEVLSVQKKDATSHAQAFVKRFFADLMPINKQNTVYIFCSYVDGVGKSTLLNNIKNYKTFNTEYTKYLRCDNSSSQESSIYFLKDKVFIADLPAQMSHFVIKPDGSVFVDYQTIKSINKTDINNIKLYIKNNNIDLINNFNQILTRISKETKYLYDYNDPIEQYSHNCFILDIKDSIWVPFKIENNYYLFNKNNLDEFKVLVSFANVHSIGLKNVEPEQMLFDKGLSISMQYDLFLEDLKKKLVAEGIEQVVFVDFLSMYPRSSRENIRVNFVLQYLKKIFTSNFAFENTFYQHRVHKEQEICHQLVNNFESTCNTLILETALRWALFNLNSNFSGQEVINLDKKKLEENLLSLTKSLLDKYYQEINNAVYQRLYSEKELYAQKYSQDLIYENIVRFSFEPILEFSQVVSAIWTKLVNNEYFNNLWRGFETIKTIDNSNEQIITVNDTELEVKFKINKKCKDEDVLKKISNLFRAQYYAILSNLLEAQIEDNYFIINKIFQYVPSITLAESNNNDIYILQKTMPLIDDEKINIEPPLKFHLINTSVKKKKWGLFDQMPHCIDWTNPGTFFGLYAFGYYPFDTKAKSKTDSSDSKESKIEKNVVTALVEKYLKLFIQNNTSNFGIPVSDIYKQIESNNLWTKIRKNRKKTIEVESNDSRISAIQLWLRSIATLEMIVKSSLTKILIRKGDRKDFIATIKLLENITLPDFFGISLKEPAFQDYKLVEPVISWDLLK